MDDDLSDIATPGGGVAATILAAGLGTRLGCKPKASLQVDGVSLLQRLVTALREGGTHHVSVVIGPYRDQLVPLAELSAAQVVLHEKSNPSLIDSQRLAVGHHLKRYPYQDLMLLPCDLPLLEASDISRVVDAWQERAPLVHALIPTVEGVRGHPVLLSKHAIQQVNLSPGDKGVRDWMDTHPESLCMKALVQRAYTADVDTPEDLNELHTFFSGKSVNWPDS